MLSIAMAPDTTSNTTKVITSVVSVLQGHFYGRSSRGYNSNDNTLLCQLEPSLAESWKGRTAITNVRWDQRKPTIASQTLFIQNKYNQFLFD